MLKLFAAFCMVLDHTALAFLPSHTILYLICRLIGRLAMPIFAYKIACGFAHTHDLKKYVTRIASMTLAAQIPFVLLGLGSNFKEVFISSSGLILFAHWNIGLTFLCAIGILYILTNLKRSFSLFHLFLCLSLLLIACLGDYGIYGVCIVLLFYTFVHKRKPYTIATTLSYICYLGLITLVYYSIFFGGYVAYMLKMQLPALLAIPLIVYVPDTKAIHHKYFFYIFYPLHMLIIAILSYFL